MLSLCVYIVMLSGIDNCNRTISFVLADCFMPVGQSDWAVSAEVREDVKLANTYDTAWAIALAIHQTLKLNVSLEHGHPDQLGFSRLNGGDQFMDQLRQVRFQGVAGHVVMQKDGTKEPRFVVCIEVD